jgi:hypothetical protein
VYIKIEMCIIYFIFKRYKDFDDFGFLQKLFDDRFIAAKWIIKTDQVQLIDKKAFLKRVILLQSKCRFTTIISQTFNLNQHCRKFTTFCLLDWAGCECGPDNALVYS